MSSDYVIKVDKLSKCYQIYDKPRDRLKQMLMRGRKQYYREFWALKDLSFEVKKGETLGIIGRNGSGKSTLLQLVCGTLNPTSGSILARGRIAALLELGSGFNPEFTGRENVYMNAAIIGLSNDEINERYDDIVKFADIGDYINQPVKSYSSGMYVRLAFAVIAHVDADILVIDEALAVGDAVFTQKCMRFIRNFKKNGTLLFVSHDMNSVLSLCERAIWLHKGVMHQYGRSKDIGEAYLQYTLQEVYGDNVKLESMTKEEKNHNFNKKSIVVDNQFQYDYGSKMQICDNLDSANGWKSGDGEIYEVNLRYADKTVPDLVFEGGEEVCLEIRAIAFKEMERPILGFLVKDRLGQDLFGENTLPFTKNNSFRMSPGQKFFGEFVFRLPMLPNGQYFVSVSLADGDLYTNIQHHWLYDAIIVNVSSSKVRWGLVGVKLDNVFLSKIEDE